MPTFDLYNVNANRNEPFVDAGAAYTFSMVPLLDSFIVDAYGIVLSSRKRVALTALVRDGTDIDLVFSTEDLADVFVVTATGDNSLARVSNAAGSLTVAINDYQSQLALLTDGEAYIADEPCYLRSVKTITIPSPVASVTVASELDAAPTDCDGTPERWQFVQTAPVKTGAVKLEPGYNTAITADPETGLVTLSLQRGAGGRLCDRPDLYEYEASSSSLVPEEDIECADVVHTISGVQPSTSGVFNIRGGGGVRVDDYPDEHRIVIDLTASEDFFCYADDSFLLFEDGSPIFTEDDENLTTEED